MFYVLFHECICIYDVYFDTHGKLSLMNITLQVVDNQTANIHSFQDSIFKCWIDETVVEL